MTRLCRLFAVTRAGFYAWRRRPVSARQRQDWALLEEMRAIFAASGGTYGSPRIQHALLASAHRVSRRRVARLMRQDGLRARVVRVYRGKAGVHRWFSRQPNHVRRTQATRPNQLWVGDTSDGAEATYVGQRHRLPQADFQESSSACVGSITAGFDSARHQDLRHASVAQLPSRTARAKHSFQPTDHFPDRS